MSQAGRIQCPITAHRWAPSLLLPNTIWANPTVIGMKSKTEIRVQNVGGDGKFRIVPAGLWPEQVASAPRDMAVMDSFEVSPVFLSVPSKGYMEFRITFEPSSKGLHTASMLLVCDNCQVKQINLQGEAHEVDVVINNLDGHEPCSAELQEPLWLSEVSPGAINTRTIGIKNRTGLTFPYTWGKSRFPFQESHGQEQWLNAPRPFKLDMKSLRKNSSSFNISPIEGDIHPDESVVFTIVFSPAQLGPCVEFAELTIDKRCSDSPLNRKEHSTHVVTCLELLGLGVACPVVLEPCILSFTGSITLGENSQRHLHLINNGDANAHFSFSILDSCLSVMPQSGLIMPHSEAVVEVEVLGQDLGPGECTLTCNVVHGPSLECIVKFLVVGAAIEAMDEQIDFGCVRWGHPHVKHLTLRNLAASCEAEWELAVCKVDTNQAFITYLVFLRKLE